MFQTRAVFVMEHLSDINLFTISINLLKVIGEAKHDTSVKLLLFRILSFCVISLTFFFIFCNLFVIKGEIYVRALQSLAFISHVLLKYLLLIKYKYTVEKLIKDIVRKFWNYRNFGEDTVKIVEKNYKIVARIQTVVLLVSIILGYAYILRPLFVTNSELVFESALPDGVVMDVILLICHYSCFCMGVIVVVAYDLIYFALCVHVVIQLRLLKQKMKSLLKDYMNQSSLKINSCIGYHQFMFSIFLRMRNMYSVMLLFHYIVTLFITCSILFELLTGYANFTDYVTKLLSILFYFNEFACYSFLAEQVAFEFSDVADAVYVSHWYKNSLSTQKALLYVMLNSQQAHYFSAIGLININVEAFGSVVRKSFSFYAIIKKLLNK